MNWRLLLLLTVLAGSLFGLPAITANVAYAVPGGVHDCVVMSADASGDLRFVNNCGFTVEMGYCVACEGGLTDFATLSAGGSTLVRGSVPGSAVRWVGCGVGYRLMTIPEKMQYMCFPTTAKSSAPSSPSGSATSVARSSRDVTPLSSNVGGAAGSGSSSSESAGLSPATPPHIAPNSGPIMEEPWNGVGKPPKSSVPVKQVGVAGRSKDRPVPHLSDDQKVLAEMLRQQKEASSPKSEADAQFEAQQLEYEQKLAAQQKAVADFEAAQRQMAVDKAAAAAKASVAQQEFIRQQAAYQAEQDRYARERAEYEAKLAGGPVAAQGVGTLAPLSSGGPQAKSVQEGEDARVIASDGKPAMDCVKLIQLTANDSSMGGGGRVLSNQCSDEVEIGWCYTPGDCETETGSSWTVQSGNSWPVSAEKQIRWVACHGRNTAGFVKGSYGLRYYCKAPN